MKKDYILNNIQYALCSVVLITIVAVCVYFSFIVASV